MNFSYHTVGGPDAVPLRGAVSALSMAMTLPSWDALVIVADGADFPRMHIDWHEHLGLKRNRNGFVLHCFETGDSWGYFLAESLEFSAPDCRIELGGQAIEHWPQELFVPFNLASEALEAFLINGKQQPLLHWVQTDQIPRETLWEPLPPR